jgi:hypothetical protein
VTERPETWVFLATAALCLILLLTLYLRRRSRREGLVGRDVTDLLLASATCCLVLALGYIALASGRPPSVSQGLFVAELISAIPATLGAATTVLVGIWAVLWTIERNRATALAEQRRTEMVWLTVSLKRLDQLTMLLAEIDRKMSPAAAQAAARRAERGFDEARAALARVTIDLDVVADEDPVLELLTVTDPGEIDDVRTRLSAARVEAARSRAALRKILTRRVNGPDAQLLDGSALTFWMGIRSELDTALGTRNFSDE